MSNPVWFITGVSRGLGEILASRALAEGHLVIGTCRNAQKSAATIEPLQKRGLKVVEMEVIASQEDISKKMEEALSIYGRIDILVNNAGYAALGPLERFT